MRWTWQAILFMVGALDGARSSWAGILARFPNLTLRTWHLKVHIAPWHRYRVADTARSHTDYRALLSDGGGVENHHESDGERIRCLAGWQVSRVVATGKEWLGGPIATVLNHADEALRVTILRGQREVL